MFTQETLSLLLPARTQQHLRMGRGFNQFFSGLILATSASGPQETQHPEGALAALRLLTGTGPWHLLLAQRGALPHIKSHSNQQQMQTKVRNQALEHDMWLR